LLWTFAGQFGGGYASPVVSDGRVFVGSEYVDGFYCLNETDGALLWVSNTNGTIWNSAAVSAGMVLVGTARWEGTSESDGGLYCLNETTGISIWNITLDEPLAYYYSPAVADGRVFVGGGGGDNGSYLYCLNLSDGQILWKFQVQDTVCSSPAVTDGKVYVGAGSSFLGAIVYCINETTGDDIWTYAIMGGEGINSSPAVVNDRVFIGSFRDSQGYSSHVYCLDAGDGEQIWNYSVSSAVPASPAAEITSPAVAYGEVFAACFTDGNVYCLNATTGTEIWTYSPGVALAGLASPSVADGMVFISNEESGLVVLNTTDGEMIWNYGGVLSTCSSVAIADGSIFTCAVGSARSICCIGSLCSLTVTPTFSDNYGNALWPAPSEWSVLFPNGTIIAISSNSVTCPQVNSGNYSIVSIIWQGYEVVPDEKPTIYLTSNYTWMPTINCKLPTYLNIDLSTSTSLVGFWVSITGRLVDYENMSITGALILLEYSPTGGGPWSTITADYTAADGSYSALWIPTATGNFAIDAIWQGNETYPNTTSTVNLAVLPYEEKQVFSVISNSSLSQIAFNATDQQLSFTVTGPSGTIGYTKVTVAKSLAANPANIAVYLDGKQTPYSLTSTDDSWLLTFNYTHSTHKVFVDLNKNAIPEFSYYTILFLFATLTVIIFSRRRTRKN
jgi:outer membrane protein assembly factor BamB